MKKIIIASALILSSGIGAYAFASNDLLQPIPEGTKIDKVVDLGNDVGYGVIPNDVKDFKPAQPVPEGAKIEYVQLIDSDLSQELLNGNYKYFKLEQPVPEGAKLGEVINL